MRTQDTLGASTTRSAECTGMLWIHSAPVALEPHLNWALARLALPGNGRAAWRTRKDQPATTLCAEIEFRANSNTIDALIDDLTRWPTVIFELAVDAPAANVHNTMTGTTGMRFMRTPELGLYSASTDDAGNIMLNEEKLRALMAHSSAFSSALDDALGGPWDRSIEPLRPGTAGFDDVYFGEQSHGKESHADDDNVIVFHPRRAVM